jgi:photosystem II stability/assembly factor-like uncharacterized protein
MKLLNLRRPAAVALLCLVLAGCAAPSPQVGRDTKINAYMGVVALAVQNNVVGGDLFSTMLFEWKRVFVTNAAGARIELLARDEGMRNTIVFFAELGPGVYSLDEISSLGGVGRYYHVSFPKGEYQFKVEAGRVTNLGTMVTAISPQGGFSSDAKIYRGFVPSDQELTDYLRGAFPSILQSQQGRAFLTWTSPDVAQRTAEIAQRIRRLSVAANSPVRLKDGPFVAGAPMGIVWRRNDAHEWESLDTGYAREITALTPLADGSVLAAAEGGVLLRSADRGATWQNLGNLPQYGLVVGLGQFPGGALFALVRDKKAHLLTAAVPEGPWGPVGAFDSTLGKGKLALDGFESLEVRAVQGGPRLALFVKSREVRIYDSATGTWTQTLLPGDLEASAGFDDGSFYVGHRVNVEQGNTQAVLRRTADAGKTWTDVAAFDGRTQEYTFFSPSVLLRSTAVATEKPGDYPTEHELAYSVDAGLTWTTHPKSRRFHLSQRAALDGSLWMLFFGDGISVSADQGKTWKAEKKIFPTYNDAKEQAPKDGAPAAGPAPAPAPAPTTAPAGAKT